jgi:hypothetical protein
MPAQPPQRLGDPVRHFGDGGQVLAQADGVVFPRSAAQAVQSSLDRQLSRLLGEKARPVVEPTLGLKPRGAQRRVGLSAPAAELIMVNRRAAHGLTLASA